MASSTLVLNVLGSIQRALLGYVTPSLRAVDVVIENEQRFSIIFYYERKIDEDEEELSSLVETEFISDFPVPDYQTNRIIKILPYPNKIPQNGFLVYKRYEK
jgi:hypothetical protein